MKLPFFSVIIPTYDRPAQLHWCLDALTHLDYPADHFEVVVVDDGSPASLEPVTDAFCDQLALTLCRQANAGPAAARNAGARQASGTFLAFTDDDCRPEPRWLNALAAQFEETPTHLVGGHTVNMLSRNPFATASQLLVSYLYDYYNDGQARFFTSNNIAVPADDFHEVGGFDAIYMRAAAEDREFCDRWLHSGRSMSYTPRAVVCHAHPMDLCSFWRQHFNYGRGAFYFHEVRSERGQASITPEPPSFYWNLLRYPFSHRSGTSAFVQALLMGVSQVANTTGFFYEMGLRSLDR